MIHCIVIFLVNKNKANETLGIVFYNQVQTVLHRDLDNDQFVLCVMTLRVKSQDSFLNILHKLEKILISCRVTEWISLGTSTVLLCLHRNNQC